MIPSSQHLAGKLDARVSVLELEGGSADETTVLRLGKNKG